jgi:hypothetical protein
MSEREDIQDDGRDADTYKAPNVEDFESPDGDAVVVTAAGFSVG